MLSDIIPFPDPHFLYTSLFLILPPYGLYNITLPNPSMASDITPFSTPHGLWYHPRHTTVMAVVTAYLASELHDQKIFAYKTSIACHQVVRRSGLLEAHHLPSQLMFVHI